jgi:hypothetical protein
MKIEKLINIGNLPKGKILVTTLSDSISENRKWRGILNTLPMGVSKINDRYFFTILAEDAITFNIPHMKIQQVENHEKSYQPTKK